MFEWNVGWQKSRSSSLNDENRESKLKLLDHLGKLLSQSNGLLLEDWSWQLKLCFNNSSHLTHWDNVCWRCLNFWWKVRHFLYSEVTAFILRFQYLPSNKMVSARLWRLESMGDENWHTPGLRPAISAILTVNRMEWRTKLHYVHWMCQARQMMLFKRILSFMFNLSPLNAFHLGDVILPSNAKLMHWNSLVRLSSIITKLLLYLVP